MNIIINNIVVFNLILLFLQETLGLCSPVSINQSLPIIYCERDDTIKNCNSSASYSNIIQAEKFVLFMRSEDIVLSCVKYKRREVEVGRVAKSLQDSFQSNCLIKEESGGDKLKPFDPTLKTDGLTVACSRKFSFGTQENMLTVCERNITCFVIYQTPTNTSSSPRDESNKPYFEDLTKALFLGLGLVGLAFLTLLIFFFCKKTFKTKKYTHKVFPQSKKTELRLTSFV